MKLFLLLLTFSSLVSAEEIRVLSGGAAKSLVDPLAASFKGGTVKVEYQPMGKLVQSLKAGDAADMVIVTTEVLPSLQLEGKAIARVGIGVAVNEKAQSPDISTVEAFRKTLLAAKSVVYIDPKVGTSGKHVAQILEQLGISQQINSKATLGQGGYITEPVGRGEIELGIHQISEILPVKGVKLVGPLPAELQKYTVYVAAPSVKTAKKATVDAFIAHLTGAEARGRLEKAGYTAPE
ncbi:MAG: molybdate transport system substrate-binding protein [Betaproteobacteria bacterium]|jgi:molybdate transport system substrate-binding protein|nr:molybdate transport system substrate-binding protein [Betaproteobacteria bacterium]